MTTTQTTQQTSELHEGLIRAIQRSFQLLRPPPDMLPSEWAEQNVSIPLGNAVPGPYRLANAPYQREPMDMFADPDCYRVTLQWGAQVGKTLLALCVQAYSIAVSPRSQIMMQPSQGDVQTWLETKFSPLVDANEGLRNLIAKPRGRDGVNNQRMKSYPGGFMMLSWSGSPKTMRGRSAPLIVVDEVDGYEATQEGHPVQLLWQRAATFGDQRMLYEISTPTIKGESYIERAFEAGDQRRFYVVCPHCGHHQTLRWEQVVWDGKAKPEGEQRPETAAYVCEECGVLLNDGERIAMIRDAERQGAGWKAAKPFKGHASYHLNELYSTFRRLRDIVQSYLDKLAQNDLQTFVNVSLAETYEEQGEQADPDKLATRAEDWGAPVPAGGLVLTAGVDMQKDRLEVEIVAWGMGEESWSIDYEVLWGDPLQGDVWDELEELLSSTWLHESGAQMSVTAACVDTGGTGGDTQAAYDWLRGKTGRRIFGIKGIAGWGRPIVASPSRKQSGKTARKVDLFLVGVDEAKLVVMRRLAVQKHGPGFCHVPKSRDAEWYAQITAEKLVTKYVKGFPVREWHKTRPRNEALDCRVYALAALKIVNPSFKRAAQRLGQMDKQPAPAPAPEPVEQMPLIDRRSSLGETPKIKRSRALRPKRGGWVSNW
ncbi:phage terminase large subunit family protein (plasmid) [Roseomonas marmotae]|uniref:phage terminase large subunit family protein n=1 Tax=Roseomonas marmotae TaxID=2768161 RepID=UPI001AD78F61|nr:phage terminase large subunit family protein [Roseomonas marmotae]QTI81481.1 phage terminase large subunit family protein [Roseomonas marmotae]